MTTHIARPIREYLAVRVGCTFCYPYILGSYYFYASDDSLMIMYLLRLMTRNTTLFRTEIESPP